MAVNRNILRKSKYTKWNSIFVAPCVEKTYDQSDQFGAVVDVSAACVALLCPIFPNPSESKEAWEQQELSRFREQRRSRAATTEMQ